MKTNFTKQKLSRFLICGILIAFSYVNLISAEDINSSKIVEVYAFNTPPTIDGIIDDGWACNEFQNIEKIIEEYCLKTEFEKDDFGAKFKIGWYGNKLYFLVVVTDEYLFKDGEAIYENDHFMLVLDLGNEKTENNSAAAIMEDSTGAAIIFDNNDHNIIIPWGKSEEISIWSGDPKYEYTLDKALYEYRENIDIDNKTFIAEFAFDVTDFNMPAGLSEDTGFGFDIVARDFDLNWNDEWGVYLLEEEIWAQWNSETTEGFYNRAESGTIGLGSIQLKSAKAPTAIHNNDFNSNITLYPMPTHSVLNIQSDAIITYIEIYNILGSQVLSSQLNNNSVDVSNLLKGIYTVNMYDETGNVTSQKIMIE